MIFLTLAPFTILIRVLLVGILTFASSANAMTTWDENSHGSALFGDALQLDSELPGKCIQYCSSDLVMTIGVCNDCLGSVILTSGVPAIDSHPASCKLMQIFEPATVFFDLNLPPPK